jgi:hypothetical protein
MVAVVVDDDEDGEPLGIAMMVFGRCIGVAPDPGRDAEESDVNTGKRGGDS